MQSNLKDRAKRDRTILFAAGLAALVGTFPADAQPAVPVTACDLLAASPDDSNKHPDVQGVETFADRSAAETAVAACRNAVAAEPSVDRMKYQLARALNGAGQAGEAVEWYERVARSDYAAALVDLGLLYLDGIGVKPNPATALSSVLEAAEAGDPRGMFWAARFYRDGVGVETNYDKARGWALRGADAGNSRSMTILAGLYRDGLGVQQNSARAIEWYRKASAAGDLQATYRLASLYLDGIDGVAPEPTLALPLLQDAAKGGNLSAIMRLAQAYRDGEGVSPDPGAAFQLLLEAAKAGVPSAMQKVADAYKNGTGAQADEGQWVLWLTKAAAHGDEEALFQLGVAEVTGEIDPSVASQAYMEAAEGGSTIAMRQLAQAFRHGAGVTRSDEIAIGWLKKAAAAGDAAAMREIGEAYRSGIGATEDVAELRDGLPKFHRQMRLAVQKRLAELGLYAGAMDGRLGPGSQKAIRVYLGLP